MTNAMQYCTFWLDGLFLGIEVQRVQEVLRHLPMTDVPLVSGVISGLINLRGQIVTAINLRERMELPQFPGEADEQMNFVVRCDDDVVSLLVDRIGDVVEVTEEALEAPPPTIAGVCRDVIRGVNKMPDGLLLLLDLDRALAITPTLTATEAIQPAS
ncbi:MAG: chemotaxis protein CheW [Planctomycetota bacterium]